MSQRESHDTALRKRLHDTIFGIENVPGAPGRSFDISLIFCITLSLLAVMLESVASIEEQYGLVLDSVEWGFTILFSIEYLLRLYCADDTRKYALSPFGIIDLLAVLPTYLSIFFPSAQALIVLRAMRMLRIFKILNLPGFMSEAEHLTQSLKNARSKILVFLFTLLVLATIFGTILYIVEDGQHGFSSIPRSIYWAIITITTVGYGDIAPATPIGQFIAALVTLTGYSIIAVPTGIITAEISREFERRIVLTGRQSREHLPKVKTQRCRNCGHQPHDLDASHCKLCGAQLVFENKP